MVMNFQNYKGCKPGKRITTADKNTNFYLFVSFLKVNYNTKMIAFQKPGKMSCELFVTEIHGP